VTLSGTGFTLSIFVYQGISKKNAKYKTVQILASSRIDARRRLQTADAERMMNDTTKMASMIL
jgi:Na+/H+ antiporter NhaA